MIGWLSYAWIQDDLGNSAILFLATVAAIYWYVMGTMLTAEHPVMSRRVRRRLPTSVLGRGFFTWFNPGPATGYMFAVASASAIGGTGSLGSGGGANGAGGDALADANATSLGGTTVTLSSPADAKARTRSKS